MPFLYMKPFVSHQISGDRLATPSVSGQMFLDFFYKSRNSQIEKVFLTCSTRHSLESVQRQFWSLRRSKLLSVSATRQRNTLIQHNPPIIFSLERNSSWTTPCNGFLVVLKSQPLRALCCMAKPGGYVDHAGSVDNGRGHWQGRVVAHGRTLFYPVSVWHLGGETDDQHTNTNDDTDRI